MSTRVLVVGCGGREHALAKKLSESPRISALHVAPGSDAIKRFCHCVPISSQDIEGLARFAEKNADITLVGPDNVIADGIADYFATCSLPIFAPTRSAARIESSKAYAKQLMLEEGVPTAESRTFSDYNTALAYLKRKGAPIVVKASGLALGKGAYPCTTLPEAKRALREVMVQRVHGKAGDEVVVEEYLEGYEVSLHAFCDGTTSEMFPASQDHKRLYDGDRGPNTGGMGAYAPVPFVNEVTMSGLRESVVRPVLERLRRDGNPFAGCLYPGVMITSAGPKVLEYNACFGDPETQVYMPLLATDPLDIIEACVGKSLASQHIEWHKRFAVCVVMASRGYGTSPQPDLGKRIKGLYEAERMPQVTVYHAGTTRDDGKWYTAGGRVLGVTATGETLRGARDLAYEAVGRISFEGMHFRRDIAAGALANQ